MASECLTPTYINVEGKGRHVHSQCPVYLQPIYYFICPHSSHLCPILHPLLSCPPPLTSISASSFAFTTSLLVLNHLITSILPSILDLLIIHFSPLLLSVGHHLHSTRTTINFSPCSRQALPAQPSKYLFVSTV